MTWDITASKHKAVALTKVQDVSVMAKVDLIPWGDDKQAVEVSLMPIDERHNQPSIEYIFMVAADASTERALAVKQDAEYLYVMISRHGIYEYLIVFNHQTAEERICVDVNKWQYTWKIHEELGCSTYEELGVKYD